MLTQDVLGIPAWMWGMLCVLVGQFFQCSLYWALYRYHRREHLYWKGYAEMMGTAYQHEVQQRLRAAHLLTRWQEAAGCDLETLESLNKVKEV